MATVAYKSSAWQQWHIKVIHQRAISVHMLKYPHYHCIKSQYEVNLRVDQQIILTEAHHPHHVLELSHQNSYQLCLQIRQVLLDLHIASAYQHSQSVYLLLYLPLVLHHLSIKVTIEVNAPKQIAKNSNLMSTEKIIVQNRKQLLFIFAKLDQFTEACTTLRS